MLEQSNTLPDKLELDLCLQTARSRNNCEIFSDNVPDINSSRKLNLLVHDNRFRRSIAEYDILWGLISQAFERRHSISDRAPELQHCAYGQYSERSR